jgi:hypothetical protein
MSVTNGFRIMSPTPVATAVGITVGIGVLVAAAVGMAVGVEIGVGGVSTFAGLHADKNNTANMMATRLIDRGSFGRGNIVRNLSRVIWPSNNGSSNGVDDSIFPTWRKTMWNLAGFAQRPAAKRSGYRLAGMARLSI